MSYTTLFFTRKNTKFSVKNSLIRPFFTLFVLSRASDNTISLNIGGSMHGPSPHLKFWGDRPPDPLLGLRPCFLGHLHINSYLGYPSKLVKNMSTLSISPKSPLLQVFSCHNIIM